MSQESRLGDDVRLVILQFSFSNPDAVPEELRRLPPEGYGKHVERKQRGNGIQFISPTEQADLFDFLDGLALTGYDLVNVLYQERIDQRDPGQTFHMVRFTFALQEYAQPSEAFLQERSIVLEKLRDMCRVAFWRVRVFRNPFFKDGEPVSDVYAMSVNLEARVPRFERDGTPVVSWEKDETGRRIGSRPVPIRRKARLIIEDAAVHIVSA